MVITYEDVTPSLIANTTMQKRLFDGVHKTYLITPNEGYVLHDNTLDECEYDPETGELIRVVNLGYTDNTTTCGYNYDFAANSREFYAVLRTEVPENQIFGGGNNSHENM
jgi:hypothetical protein